MKLVIQPGPDAGSGMVTTFLAGTQRHLTVGMYDFTAPHLVSAMVAALQPDKTLSLVLQRGESIGGTGAKGDDYTDAHTVALLAEGLGERFSCQWASVGAGAVFPYAYHIKVAARDDRAIWLSSGNWQSSNQPRATPEQDNALLDRHNREFHVTLEHAGIATLYREHIERDAEEAKIALERPATLDFQLWVPDDLADAMARESAVPYRYFDPLEIDRPVAVQPLLTPDNFAKHLLPLIEGARESILFQNQSFSIAKEISDDFRKLLKAMLAKQREPGIDVRIILRGEYARDQIEAMKSFGFVVDRDHVRAQERCHNKMWIFDAKHTLIGSHNFTNSGTTTNRDASLIFRDDPEIAAYCSEVFDYDWQRCATARLPEARRAARRAIADEPPPKGMRAVFASSLGLL